MFQNMVLAPDGVAHQWQHTRVTRLGNPVNADWLGVTPYTCMTLHQKYNHFLLDDDLWPKILLIWTQHWRNFITKLHNTNGQSL